MKHGYARVSTKDQSLELQIEALEKYGCERIFQEKVSAVKERPQLEKMLSYLDNGDTVVVYKLDRLGRSLKHLIDLISKFKEMGVEFVSLNDNIDTTTVQGRLMFNIFASFAEFERELIRERTRAGLEAARAKGRIGGRKPGLSNEAKTTAFAALHLKEKGDSVSDIIKVLNISRATYYRYIDYAKNTKWDGKLRRVRRRKSK